MAGLIVINGVPGLGKTTLARRIQKELSGEIFLIKDDFKEFLFDALPQGDFEWSKLLSKAPHPGHLDLEGVTIESAIYAPLEIGETMYVDTIKSLDDETVKELATKTQYFLNGALSSMVT